MHDSNHKRRWEAGLILVTALWGWSFVAIHESLAELSDSAFNAYRFLIAAAAMSLVVVARRKAVPRADLVQGGMVGVALYVAHFFQTKGLTLTTPSNAAFITGLAVVFTPLILLVWGGTRPDAPQLAGASLATAGLALLTLRGLSIQVGDVLVLMCAASFALHIVLLSRASKVADVLNIAFIQISVVGALSLAQSILFKEFSIPRSGETAGAIGVIAVFGTAVAFFVQTKAQVASTPNRIALIIVLEPAFGKLFGYLAGDRLTAMNWIGAALIVLGMLVTEVQFTRRGRSAETGLTHPRA